MIGLRRSILARSRGVFGALILVLLPACVSVEQQCREGQWYQLGKSNGELGYSEDFSETYRKNCPPLGVTPDEEALQEGWTEGNRRYCLPESIREAARVGSLTSFPDVCEWQTEELWPYYVDGRCVRLAFQIPSNEESLVKLQRKLEKIHEKAKKPPIHFLIVNLRSAIRNLKSEWVELGCEQ